MKGYCIITHTANGITMLADRAKTQSAWWTVDVSEAMVFRSRWAAADVCAGFKYNNPQVVSCNEVLSFTANTSKEQ